MSTQGQHEKQGDPREASAPVIDGGLVNPSRRRFGKAGLATSGVLATLAARPVLGDPVCKTPSGFLSGNLSRPGSSVCQGRSPGYWKTHEGWPIPNRTTSKFSSVYSVPKVSNVSAFKTVTLLAILDHQDYDTYNLGMHLSAAYLNLMAGWTPFLTLERLQAMWNECRNNGYFAPVAGVKWSPDQVVDYLKSTMI